MFQFFGNVVLWFSLPQYIAKVSLKKLNPFRNLKVILSLFIPALAIQLYVVLDKIMLGFFSDNFFENGYYEQAMKISRLVLTIVISLGTVMVPRIGFLFEQKQYEQIKEYMYKSYQFVCFLGIPLCIGLIIISDNLVPWFFGIEFNKVANILKISALLILGIGISNVTGVQYLIPTKRQNLFTITVIGGAIINLVLNIILIPNLYSIGAAISSVIAELFISIIQLLAIKNEINIKRILKNSINYFVAGLIMGCFLLGENMIMRPSIYNTMIMFFSGIIIYGIILIFLKDDFFISNLRKLSH